jgi:RimJ/RimL family protein N-acetyltransferase
LRPWMAWARGDYTLEACEINTRQAIAKFVTRQDLRYQFVDRTSGEMVGSSGLHRINWQVPRFEIGYWVRTSRSGQGYVGETVRALTRLAFEALGARRVEIRCDDLNLASARVAERCGFELDTILRNWQRGPDGTLRHERIYSMVDPFRLSH